MKFRKTAISVIIVLVALFTIVGLSGLNFIFTGTQQDLGSASSKRQSVERVQNPSDSLTSMEAQKVSLLTKDNVKVAANLYAVENPVGWLVFIHMMPATKESWNDLAREFQGLGYESIAIDLRGHGESAGGPNGYKSFSDSEHQAGILDLGAAVDYLIKERGVRSLGSGQANPKKISLIGASIGSNLAIEYLSGHSELTKVVLLSPGLNYRGVKTESLVSSLKTGQKVLFVSSRDDGNDAEQNQKLYDLVPDGVVKKIQIYSTGGHGTDMLSSHPELKDLVIDFITSV